MIIRSIIRPTNQSYYHLILPQEKSLTNDLINSNTTYNDGPMMDQINLGLRKGQLLVKSFAFHKLWRTLTLFYPLSIIYKV